MATDDFFRARLDQMIDLRHHQADGQPRPPGIADTCAGHRQAGAEHVRALDHAALAIDVRKRTR
jgi:hypothetical protein